jgi:hypothetical protein
MGQAVVLLSIVAMAASCAASKEYTSKLFAPRDGMPVKDSQATALRFLELDNLEPDQDNWVTTDIIMGRDTMSKTLALDKLARIYPATPVSNDSTLRTEESKTPPVLVAKPVPAQTEQVKTNPAPVEVKTEPVETEPVARAANPGEVRNKRSRD